ncbi:MAG: esterase-like activity of phytase family protein [Proteobacteria bacterium]|nr:esterase-like activity of phytase family protein [Pseudomonadota bacterium]MDA1356657.1 esterase-like activity of phytase family protein [Pseudomonadota bacterium]
MKKPPTLHLIVLALALFLSTKGAGANDIELSYSQVPLNYEMPDQHSVGMLEYRGGLSISARDSQFGGLSSLLVSADGKLLLAASDRGVWFSAALDYGDDGNLVGLSSARLAPITGSDGKPLTGRYRDAEGLARADDGTVVLAFEQHHRILRFATSGLFDADHLSAVKPDLVAAPAELAEFNSNAAMEALVTLADGGLLSSPKASTMTGRANRDGFCAKARHPHGWNTSGRPDFARPAPRVSLMAT